MAFGLGIGKASTLEAEGRNDVIAGTQLMLSPSGGRLDPEKLLACQFGNRSHRASLKDQLPRLFGVFLVPNA
jgi:hypothetical protein